MKKIIVIVLIFLISAISVSAQNISTCEQGLQRLTENMAVIQEQNRHILTQIQGQNLTCDFDVEGITNTIALMINVTLGNQDANTATIMDAMGNQKDMRIPLFLGVLAIIFVQFAVGSKKIETRSVMQ